MENTSEKIKTHQAINRNLCGTPVSLAEGSSEIKFTATTEMIADDKNLIHGGFVFGLADYAAMLAVNHPNVVLGSSDVKFLKPVRLYDELIAKAETTEIKGKKHIVSVSVLRGNEAVFSGTFTCFTLEKHVLD